MGCYPEKNWHRFTKNNFQIIRSFKLQTIRFFNRCKNIKKRFKDITNIDYDNYKPKRPVEGDSILIIPPSLKSIKMFDYNETYRFYTRTLYRFY